MMGKRRMVIPMIRNSEAVAEVTGKGAYDFPFAHGIYRSKSGKLYAITGAFGWHGQTGGYRESGAPISQVAAQPIIDLIHGGASACEVSAAVCEYVGGVLATD
jgi:hypothetical protein